jgi:Divergent InlB B-repeat domain/IPT/TIG domain
LNRPSFAPVLRHQIAVAAAFSAMLIFTLLFAPGSAIAGVSGQIGTAWKPVEEIGGMGLFELNQVGVDPSDGSVFIANSDAEFENTIIRKFSSTGTFEGSVSLPGRAYQGIAVDPTAHRFYVVKDEGEEQELKASKILAFSTIPSGAQLQPATEPELPVPTGSAALAHPQEIVLDPSSGDLIVVGKEAKEVEENGVEVEKEFTTLQRIDVAPITGAGTVGGKFTDEVVGAPGQLNERAITVDKAGVTYLLAENNNASAGQQAITAQYLPPNFSASSELTPVPGFEAAADIGRIVIRRGPNKPNFGPQVAVSTSASGEDTLYWKQQAGSSNNILVESYSVAGKSRANVFGGGSEEGECSITSPPAALVAEENGDLAVFSQGSAVGPGEARETLPDYYQFGPGGSRCRAPAPAFKLESGGSTVTSVQSGSTASTVTLNGSETELNGATTLEGGSWKVEGPEAFSEPISGSNLTLSHKFRAPGHYTIRMMIEAKEENLGKMFSAQPRTLEVTVDPAVSIPTVTGVTPDEGATTGGRVVTITGTNLTGTAVVKFGDTGVVCAETPATCEVVSDTEVKATAPVLPAGIVNVHAINGAGESPTNSPADEFTAVLPPVVSGVTPNKGPSAGGTEVTITGTNLTNVTEVKFGSVGVVCTNSASTCKVESDTEVKATSPVMPAGELDVHAVAGEIESPVNSPGDLFSSVAGKFSLTVAKAGSGAGTVSSSPGGINCGTACTGSFTERTSVTLTAGAASGSTFAGWGGACSGVASTCVVPMNAAETVTATFNANPPAEEHKTTESKSTTENKSTPVETHPGPGPTPKTKAEILAAKRKAALKKCQKVKGKAKAMCVKKANQIGKPKPKKVKKPKKK